MLLPDVITFAKSADITERIQSFATSVVTDYAEGQITDVTKKFEGSGLFALADRFRSQEQAALLASGLVNGAVPDNLKMGYYGHDE